MAESIKDRLSRLALMASGSSKWDLSDNDCAAIQWALRQIEELRADKDRLDWLGYTQHRFVRGTDVSQWCIQAPQEGIRAIREAIDAVMQEPEIA